VLVFFVLFARQVTAKVCNVKEIREWLESEGQDYAQGVALYAAHGKSRVVLKSLQYGATEFTRTTLRRELAKLAECHTNTSAIAMQPAKSAPVAAQAAFQPPINVQKPTPDDDLRAQRSTWYAERDRLHAQLELVASDAERCVMAERILVLAELLASSYEVASPAPTQTSTLNSVQDAGEIRRLLANLRPQASKLKKKPERAADLQQVLVDINTLETKLKKP
jgi:hypothetical protein